jgi:small subunit ribosomal protein S9
MDIINAVGRRKAAVARVYLKEGTGNILINKRDLVSYFPEERMQYVVNQPFLVTENLGKFDVKVNLDGGGFKGQAEALRLAISRALIEYNADMRPTLKKSGFLTRDAREVERKKPGQKKARKKFQFSKR